MPCYLKLAFPQSVRIENISRAMAILCGNTIRTAALNDGAELIQHVPGIQMKALPESIYLVHICITDAGGRRHWATYDFEGRDARVLEMLSTPFNIALARRLTQTFGGRLHYSAQRGEPVGQYDFTAPVFLPEDDQEGPAFAKIQDRLRSLKPLLSSEISYCVPFAAYPEKRAGFEAAA